MLARGHDSVVRLTFHCFGVEFDRFEIRQVLKALEGSIVEEELRSNQMQATQTAVVHECRSIDASGFVGFDDHRSHGIVGKLLAGNQFDHFGEFRRLNSTLEIRSKSLIGAWSTT